MVDEVLLSVMRAPRTFTREDVVEITCHGGLLPAKMVLDTVLENGARLAEPGEFTRRAFLNGRIDLTQAEAVADLIQARTELAAAAAAEQLAGHLSRRINSLRDDLMKILAHIEAHIDFPDEDIAPDTGENLMARLQAAAGVHAMNCCAPPTKGGCCGAGFGPPLWARPNVWQIQLAQSTSGTGARHCPLPCPAFHAHDTIEETASVRGLPVIFIDTAGLREATDEIEVEGVRRSRHTLAAAELILHVLDGSEPAGESDQKLLTEYSGRPRLLVCNKADLPRRLHLPGELAAIEVCCLTGAGIETLKDAIKATVWAGGASAEMLQVMINSRHENALRRGREAAERALRALRGQLGLELAAVDLRLAANAVGEIVGKTTTEGFAGFDIPASSASGKVGILGCQPLDHPNLFLTRAGKSWNRVS